MDGSKATSRIKDPFKIFKWLLHHRSHYMYIKLLYNLEYWLSKINCILVDLLHNHRRPILWLTGKRALCAFPTRNWIRRSVWTQFYKLLKVKLLNLRWRNILALLFFITMVCSYHVAQQKLYSSSSVKSFKHHVSSFNDTTPCGILNLDMKISHMLHYYCSQWYKYSIIHKV